jgi:hypothetical protein
MCFGIAKNSGRYFCSDWPLAQNISIRPHLTSALTRHFQIALNSPATKRNGLVNRHERLQYIFRIVSILKQSMRWLLLLPWVQLLHKFRLLVRPLGVFMLVLVALVFQHLALVLIPLC